MSYPKDELAQLVIAHCVSYEIEDVVISPGSRNAPLTIGFTNHPKIKTYSITDERCAAFFRLGHCSTKETTYGAGVHFGFCTIELLSCFC